MGQKEWIIPCNPTVYRIQDAFAESDTLYWRKNANYEIGDIVYIYLSKGYSRIMYKTVVIDVDILYEDNNDPFWIDQTEKSKHPQKVLLKRINMFDDNRLSFHCLQANGLKSTIQGPIKLKGELLNYVHRIDSDCVR